MHRPLQTTVHVTTKDEVDVALAAADQVVVEGDDELLTYAVNKAAGDLDGGPITVMRAFVKNPRLSNELVALKPKSRDH